MEIAPKWRRSGDEIYRLHADGISHISRSVRCDCNIVPLHTQHSWVLHLDSESSSAIVATSARPVFVDIDPDMFLMDTSRLEERLTARTQCILPVHLYDQCADSVDEVEYVA